MGENLLENLPKQIVENELGPWLDLKTLARIDQVSKCLHTTFQKPFTERKKEEFLKYVKYADYIRVEKFIVVDPSLMFKEVNGESPLEHVLKVCDIYMLQIFSEAIQNKQDQELSKLFLEQLKKPVNHLDLTPLLDVYDHYLELWNLRLKNRGISYDQIDDAWLLVGKAQSKYLAGWVFKYLCNKQTDWKNGTAVTTKDSRPKGECMVKACYGDKQNKDELLDFKRLGVDFTLLCIENMGVCALGVNDKQRWVSSSYAGANREAINQLWEARKIEFQNFVKQQLASTQEVDLSQEKNSCLRCQII